MRAKRSSERLELRKLPVQDRSQARLDRIVAVAEAMIVENGLLNLSIREVARRADTNIATFYQFFPNRGSLTRRIVEIYNEKLERHLAEALGSVTTSSGIRASLLQIQSAMVSFYANHPATLEIWPSIQADHTLRVLDREDSNRNAALLIHLISTMRPKASRADVEAAADLIVLTAGPVFRNAVTLPQAKRRRILAQHLDMVTSLIERL